MEEMNLLQAKKMYATLCDVLDARKFPYEKDEENLIVDMDGVGDDLPMQYRIKVNAERMLVTLYSKLPLPRPASRLSRINQGALRGQAHQFLPPYVPTQRS